MDVREKLVELIGSTEYGNGSLVGKNFQKGFIEKIASNLIAHGVTVQSEIDAKTFQLMREFERLKEEKESLANAVNVLEEINSDLCKQIKCVTVHEWKPISEPPKEKGTYLVCTDNGGVLLGHWYGTAWNAGGGTKKHLAYWMEKPQPPKGE